MWRAHDVGVALDRWRDCGACHIHVLVHPRSTSPTVLWERLRTVTGSRAAIRVGDAAIQDRLLDPAAADVVRRARERIGGDGPRPDLA
jgi:hypothetical protein